MTKKWLSQPCIPWSLAPFLWETVLTNISYCVEKDLPVPEGISSEGKKGWGSLTGWCWGTGIRRRVSEDSRYSCLFPPVPETIKLYRIPSGRQRLWVLVPSQDQRHWGQPWALYGISWPWFFVFLLSHWRTSFGWEKIRPPRPIICS